MFGAKFFAGDWTLEKLTFALIFKALSANLSPNCRVLATLHNKNEINTENENLN